MADSLLDVTEIETCYGVSQVLFGMSLAVGRGEMVTLMGRNGMGKTTTVRSIMGLTRARAGEIRFDGADIRTLPAYRVAQLGIGLVPEGRQIFSNLTTRENLVATAANRGLAADPWTLDKVCDLFPRLAARLGSMGGQLSGGEQQMLAVGRALLTNPSLLLMDEPSEGLAPVIVERIGEIMAGLRSSGLSIFLVEQNYGLAVDLADIIYILSNGRVVWQGTASELEGTASVRETHLGI